MKRLSAGVLLFLPLLVWGCSETLASDMSSWIASHQGMEIVGGSVSVDVGFSGSVAQVELLVDDVSAGLQDVTEDVETVTLAWDSSAHADGEATLVARLHDSSGHTEDSDPVQIVVDNTPPEVTFGIQRMGVFAGTIDIPATIVESHGQTVRLVDRNGTLLEVAAPADTIQLDTATLTDGLYWLSVEAVDQAGNSTLSNEIPVVVANNGHQVTDVQYVPEAMVSIPTNWATTEYHTRGMIESDEGVTRIVSWLTWDASQNWDMEYKIGEGICPHRGIEFTVGTSDSGEIIIDLPRSELAEAAVSRLPAEEQTSTTFPHNDDIATFGAFFGHASPVSPADHVNQSVAIEMHFVLFY